MNWVKIPTLIAVIAGAIPAAAHGPQLQVTADSNKIVTRTLLSDGPYSTALSPPKSAYVMPVLPSSIASGTVWYSRPNQALNPVTQLPAFPSGPGLAYGFDLVDGGPQVFETGSVLSVGFTAGLKRWNGAAFVDAGATQLKAFTGSNPETATNFAITTDTGPFANLPLPAVEAGYGSEGVETHDSVRYALLGDGTSPTAASPDGIYLLSLALSSTQAGLNASDEYYFVLNKKSDWSTVTQAVNSLGIGPALIQWTAPEPASAALIALALAAAAGLRVRRANRGGP